MLRQKEKRGSFEGGAQVAVGVGADDALLDVIQHEVDDRDRVGAGLLEIVQGLARRGQLQAEVATIRAENLADDFPIGCGQLFGRSGEEAGGEEDFVVGVEGVKVA